MTTTKKISKCPDCERPLFISKGDPYGRPTCGDNVCGYVGKATKTPPEPKWGAPEAAHLAAIEKWLAEAATLHQIEHVLDTTGTKNEDGLTGDDVALRLFRQSGLAYSKGRQMLKDARDRLRFKLEQAKVALASTGQASYRAPDGRMERLGCLSYTADSDLIGELEQKVEELTAGNLKKALTAWTDFAGDGIKERQIALAVHKYVADPKPSYRRVADSFGVSKTTITRWFQRYEITTGYHVPRPQPGQNLSVRYQAQAEGDTIRRTVSATVNGRETSIPMTQSQRDAIDDGDV